MDAPWSWIGFLLFIPVLVALDLGVLGRARTVMSFSANAFARSSDCALFGAAALSLMAPRETKTSAPSHPHSQEMPMTRTGRPAATPRLQIDEAIEECMVSRRNFYLGLWAGRQLDLPEEELRPYAEAVVDVDHEEPGHEDVIRKIARDFAERGREITRTEILRQLVRTHLLAARQFGMSD